MPVYDIRCDQCDDTQLDTWETKSTNPLRVCPCGGIFQRMTLSSGYGKAPGVLSDECDVTVRHGICNEDGSPRRYGFKSEMRAEAKRRGLENHVVHLPDHKGGDSSRHTSKWF